METSPIRFRLTAAIGVAAVVALAACGSTSTTAPSPSLLVNPIKQAIPADAASGLTATVTASNVPMWTATSDSTFVTVTSGGSGTTNGTITYSVAANPSTAARTAHLAVIAGTYVAVLEITQQGVPSGR